MSEIDEIVSCDFPARLQSARARRLRFAHFGQHLSQSGQTRASDKATVCTVDRATIVAKINDLKANGDFWLAHLEAHHCERALPGDAEYKALAHETEVADYLKTLSNPKAERRQKMRAIERLREVDPEKGKPYASLFARLEAEQDREVKEAARRAAAERRKRGVSIGMTKEDVLASSWGRPEKVNRTVNAYGTHEQWVYGGGNYLYFDGDRLTTIQTGR